MHSRRLFAYPRELHVPAVRSFSVTVSTDSLYSPTNYQKCRHQSDSEVSHFMSPQYGTTCRLCFLHSQSDERLRLVVGKSRSVQTCLQLLTEGGQWRRSPNGYCLKHCQYPLWKFGLHSMLPQWSRICAVAGHPRLSDQDDECWKNGVGGNLGLRAFDKCSWQNTTMLYLRMHRRIRYRTGQPWRSRESSVMCSECVAEKMSRAVALRTVCGLFRRWPETPANV